jgi:hypothetical protein
MAEIVTALVPKLLTVIVRPVALPGVTIPKSVGLGAAMRDCASTLPANNCVSATASQTESRQSKLKVFKRMPRKVSKRICFFCAIQGNKISVERTVK